MEVVSVRVSVVVLDCENVGEMVLVRLAFERERVAERCSVSDGVSADQLRVSVADADIKNVALLENVSVRVIGTSSDPVTEAEVGDALVVRSRV